MEGKPCSAANIFKAYNTWAPHFYAEKELTFVPLGKLGIARAAKSKVKAAKSTKKGHAEALRHTDGYKASQLDIQLAKLFDTLPEPFTPAADVHCDRPSPGYSHCTGATATRNKTGYFKATGSEEDVLQFQCKVDDNTYGSSDTISIPGESAIQYCNTISSALLANSHIHTIHYGPEFSPDTITRFAACISPTLQYSLPTHITTPFSVFKQQWSMPELENLYVFAVSLGAGKVCDMVINQWVKEI